MKKLNYAVISYHRPECVTIRTLLELGINKDDIIVFLQDVQDVAKYNETYPQIKKVLVEGKGVAANRNNVLRFEGYNIGDRVLLLDDDILSFTKLNLFFDNRTAKVTSRKIYEKKIFLDCINASFDESEILGSCVFGVSPTGNAMFAKTRLVMDGNFSVNKLFQGGLVGHIIDKKTYYNETYSSVEDYELQLRLYSSGKIILRRNDIAASKKPNRNYAGGLFDFYKTNKQNDDLDRLCREYSKFVKVKPDYSGVTQIL